MKTIKECWIATQKSLSRKGLNVFNTTIVDIAYQAYKIGYKESNL